MFLGLAPWMAFSWSEISLTSSAWVILLIYSVSLAGVFAFARSNAIRFNCISWPVLATDIGLVGWLVSSTGGINSDFYLMFFALVPFISFYRGLRMGLGTALIVSIAYFVICARQGGFGILPDFTFRSVMLCMFTVGMGYSARFIRQAETRLLKALDKLNERTSELEKTHAHLQTIYETSRSLTELMSVDNVIDRLLQIARSVLDYPVCEIYTWETPTGTLWLNGRVDHLQTSRLKKPERVELTDTLRRAIEDGEVGRVTDRHAGRSIIDGNPNRSRLIVPMISEGKVIGLLSAESPNPSAFSEHDEQVLAILAASTAMSLVNADLHQRMEKLTVFDELTGVHNYRHFRGRLEDERRRAVRYGQPLSLVMVDIDWFKRLNDEFGHETGNIALRKLAIVINSCIRDVDILARYGGEEFIIILPQTGGTEARVIGERIRAQVERTEFGPTLSGEPLHMTVSIGISCYPDNGRPENELVETVDKALYDAKGRGKNLVCTT
jgi:diguanylate cyclase (GGDEF)-like protein